MVALLYAILSALAGVLLLSGLRFVLSPLGVLMAGVPFGMIVSAYAFSRLGCTAAAAWLGLGVLSVGAVGLAAWSWKRSPASQKGEDATLPSVAAAAAGAAILVTLHLHMLSFNGTTWTLGGYSMSDLPFHLSVTSTIAHNDVAPPRHPYCGSAPLRYHYIVDGYSAILVKLGAPLDLAIVVPDAAASICLFGLLYLLARRCGLGRRGATIAVILAALGGGTGVFHYAQMHRQDFSWSDFLGGRPLDIWPDEQLFWSALIRDYLLHARTLGPALCLAMTSWLLALGPTSEDAVPGHPADWPRARLLAAGVCDALLPLVNIHVFIGSTIILALCVLGSLRTATSSTVRGRRAGWLLAGFVPLAALTLGGLASQAGQIPGALAISHGWMECGWSLPWFWLLNAGPIFVLAPFGWTRLAGGGRRLLVGGLLVFVLGNVVVITSGWANTKLLLCWFLTWCVGAAACLDRLIDRGRVTAVLAMGLIALSGTSGVQSLLYTIGHDYRLLAAEQVEVGEYLRQHGASGDMVASEDGDALAVCAVGGRYCYAAVPLILKMHGVDSEDRLNERDRLLAPEIRATVARGQDGVQYVLARMDGSPTVNDARRRTFLSLGYTPCMETRLFILYRVAEQP